MEGTFGPAGRAGVFVGRERELAWLEDHVRRAPTKPLIVHGGPGVGKTALLNHFTRMSRWTRPPLFWLLPFDPAEARTMIKVGIDSLLEQRNPPRAIIMDEADVLAPADILDITERLTNHLTIDAVIFSRREPIEKELTGGQLHLRELSAPDARKFARQVLGPLLTEEALDLFLEATRGNPALLSAMNEVASRRSDEGARALVKGQLYGPKGSLVVPKPELLKAAKPELIRVNDHLIDRLRREPKGLYALTPRQFEEVVADLLEDMDYEVHLTPPGNDGGVDIYAYVNLPHGRILCAVEVKHYAADKPVKVGVVRQLLGVLELAKAPTAMLVTSSSFTAGSRKAESQCEHRLSLKEYGDVVQWIAEYGQPGRPRIGRF